MVVLVVVWVTVALRAVLLVLMLVADICFRGWTQSVQHCLPPSFFEEYLKPVSVMALHEYLCAKVTGQAESTRTHGNCVDECVFSMRTFERVCCCVLCSAVLFVVCCVVCGVWCCVEWHELAEGYFGFLNLAQTFQCLSSIAAQNAKTDSIGIVMRQHPATFKGTC